MMHEFKFNIQHLQPTKTVFFHVIHSHLFETFEVLSDQFDFVQTLDNV